MIGTVGTPVLTASAGTPIAVVSFVTPPLRDGHKSIHAVMFQALPTNAGKVYIGLRTMNKTALTQVLAILAIPTVNFIPTFSTALTIAPNGLALEEFYVDSDFTGEGVIVTYLVT